MRLRARHGSSITATPTATAARTSPTSRPSRNPVALNPSKDLAAAAADFREPIVRFRYRKQLPGRTVSRAAPRCDRIGHGGCRRFRARRARREPAFRARRNDHHRYVDAPLCRDRRRCGRRRTRPGAFCTSSTIRACSTLWESTRWRLRRARPARYGEEPRSSARNPAARRGEFPRGRILLFGRSFRRRRSHGRGFAAVGAVDRRSHHKALRISANPATGFRFEIGWVPLRPARRGEDRPDRPSQLRRGVVAQLDSRAARDRRGCGARMPPVAWRGLRDVRPPRRAGTRAIRRHLAVNWPTD